MRQGGPLGRAAESSRAQQGDQPAMSQATLSRQTAQRRILMAALAATAFAALTALGARLQFHLPFTPVPVTGQVFCVLLAGAALGPRLGCFSMLEYLAVGAAAGRRGGGRALAACLLGVAVIYAFGVGWYAVWCAAVGKAAGITPVLLQSVYPFLLIDVAKAGLAATVAPGIRGRMHLS